MKKANHYFIYAVSLILISGFLFSCNTTVNIAKRHHNPGFYVDISSNKPKPEKSSVKAASNEVTPVHQEKQENSSLAAGDRVSKKDEAKAQNAPSYEPLNKKEKMTAKAVTKLTDFASSVKKKGSEVFAKTNPSGLQDSKSMQESSRYLTLWLIFLIIAIVLNATISGFLAWLAWLCFLVFFILWLIEVLA